MYLDRVHLLAAKALAAGAARKSLTRIEWEVQGDCMAPVVREYHSRPSADQPSRWADPINDPIVKAVMAAFPGATAEVLKKRKPGGRYIVVRPGLQGPMTVQVTARCRKCERCLRLRGRMWSQRAVAEYRVAYRNWFGTLTLAPAVHITMLSRARERMRLQGIDFEALPTAEQFALRHTEISRELTRYLKRVRKESGAKFRFILVAEAHKSGLPHYHLLLHEHDQFNPVRKSVLESQWRMNGFSKWRLIEDERAARYVCKYLSKDAIARVRASIRYGSTAGHSFPQKT